MRKTRQAAPVMLLTASALMFTGCSAEPNPYDDSSYVVKTHFGILCEMIDTNKPISAADVETYEELADKVQESRNPDKAEYYEAFTNLAATLKDLEGEPLPASLIEEGNETCKTVS